MADWWVRNERTVAYAAYAACALSVLALVAIDLAR